MEETIKLIFSLSNAECGKLLDVINCQDGGSCRAPMRYREVEVRLYISE